MSLGGRDDIYPSANAYVAPTPASGARNRYAEIMANYQQAQPFSFTGMPSTYTGGFNANPSTYTGGFTPYQRLVTPQPALPIEEAVSATTGGGGGGANREAPSAWSQMTPAERAAYYAANPTEGSIALGMQDLLGNATLMGQIGKYFGADGWYDSRLEKLGLDPESFAYGPPDPNFSSQNAATARNEAPAPVVTTPIVEAPVPVVTAPPVVAPMPAITEGLLSTPTVVSADEAELQSLLSRYPAPVEAPVTDLPPNARFYGTGEVPPEISENDFYAAQAAANLPSEIQSLLSRYPAPVEAPVTDLPPNARFYGTGEVPPEISENDFYAAQAAANLPSEIQSLLSRYPAPVETPAPAPAPVAPTEMRTVVERWNGEESPPAGQGWQAKALGKGEVGYTRTVNVPSSGSGGGGYYGDATPGGSFGFVQAPGERGPGGTRGYSPSPGTGSYGDARSDLRGGDGFAKGGYVSMQHLNGPDPMGPDDGYAALKDGEFVINDKAVKKYGIELMNAINSGKIKKGKLLGLLEM